MAKIYGDIRFRKGLESDGIPIFPEGQPAITSDTKRVFVGTESGNIELAKKDLVDPLNTEINNARGGLPSLSERLDIVDSSLADIVTLNTNVVSEINSIIANAVANNLKVKFKKKVYDIDSPILLPDNVYVDFNRAVIRRKAGVRHFDLVKNADETNGNTGIVIKDLRLDGNKAADNLSAANDNDRFSGLKLTKVSNSKLYNVDVQNTINGEQFQTTPASGIFLVNCTDIDGYNLDGSYNDRTAIFLWNCTRVRIFGSDTHHNAGSGISSDLANECEYYGIKSHDNGYSNVSVNGLKSIVDGVRTYNSQYSGLNIGHNGFPSDETVISNVVSYSNTYDGVTFGGTTHAQLLNAVVYSNQRDNIRVFDNSSDITLANIKSRDSVGSGLRIYTGKNHLIDNAHFYRNNAHGIYIDSGVSGVKIGTNVKCYNNGQSTAGMAGILLSQATNCEVNRAECYDDQATKTQAYGLWISGGSGHTINLPDLHDNLTAPLTKTSSPTGLKESYRFPTATNYTTVTPGNGWTGTAVRYSVSADNTVQFEGVVDGASNTNPIFITMPTGLRPNATLKFPTTANGTFGEVVINSSGQITVSGGLTTAISLSTVRYKAVQ